MLMRRSWSTRQRIRLLRVSFALALLTVVFAGLARASRSGAEHGEKGENPLRSAAFQLRKEHFAGAVEEVLAAGSYTYFHVRTSGHERRWVVALCSTCRSARTLQITSYGTRDDFSSKRLGRRFDRLHFSTISEPTNDFPKKGR
jgi:hypothetical protein